MGKIYEHLSTDDRVRIEILLKAKKKPLEIAVLLNRHRSTIYREIKRGSYMHLNSDLTETKTYDASVSEARYRTNLSAKGAPLKISEDQDLAKYIENRILKDKYSPSAVLGEIEEIGLKFKISICVNTLYSYIVKGVFLHLSQNDLIMKKRRRRSYTKINRHIVMNNKKAYKSIQFRPDLINNRIDFGHWEADLVIGKKTKASSQLLVLTERVTLREKILLIKDKSASSVVDALNSLERRYGETFKSIFKSITVDNGPEFADYIGMETSIYGGKRTTLYYCHPYSSWERGSNENQNKLIRRYFPKGINFNLVTSEEVKKVEQWINKYPRKKFHYKSAEKQYNETINSILSLNSI